MSDPLVNVQAVSVTLGGNSVLSEVSLNLAPGRITTPVSYTHLTLPTKA